MKNRNLIFPFSDFFCTLCKEVLDLDFSPISSNWKRPCYQIQVTACVKLSKKSAQIQNSCNFCVFWPNPHIVLLEHLPVCRSHGV